MYNRCLKIKIKSGLQNMSRVLNNYSLTYKSILRSVDRSILVDQLDNSAKRTAYKVGNCVITVFACIALVGVDCIVVPVVFVAINSYSMCNNKTRKVAKYMFSQQLNESCHISPIRNYHLLQNFKLDLNKAIKDNSNWFDRREWFGKNQPMLRFWFEMFERLNNPEIEKDFPDLYEFIKKGVEEGPVLPNMYDEYGRNLFRCLNDFLGIPYFLIDLDAIKSHSIRILGHKFDLDSILDINLIGLKVGIIRDREGLKIFNMQENKYELITEEKHGFVQCKEVNKDGEKCTQIIFKELEDSNREELEKKYVMFPNPKEIWMTKVSYLGFEEVAVARDLGAGIILNGKKYIPYEMALCKLMLTALGVNKNNEEINENDKIHTQFKGFIEKHSGPEDIGFKWVVRGHLMQSTIDDNMWHRSKFNKDMFLQYRMAKILKDKPELKLKVAGVLDSMDFCLKKGYDKLIKGNAFCDKPRTKRMEIEEYLLGEEQALSYFFCNHLRYTWYASMNPMAYQKAYGIDSVLGIFARLYPAQYKQKELKRETLKKRTLKIGEDLVKTSFIEVWHELKKILKEENNGEDFISFDDHGWVLSLNDEIIKKQNQKVDRIYDPDFVNQLQFAGIESYLSSELDCWYKKDITLA